MTTRKLFPTEAPAPVPALPEALEVLTTEQLQRMRVADVIRNYRLAQLATAVELYEDYLAEVARSGSVAPADLRDCEEWRTVGLIYRDYHGLPVD